ncbi:MAG: hypothetical protein V4634_12355 [Pseudomonadota bacterium]
MSNPIEANIPVLTDVINPQDKPAETAAPAAAAPPAAAPAFAASQPAARSCAVPAPELKTGTSPEIAEAVAAAIPAPAISEDDWLRLEQSIRESVLKQVLARVDFVLEHRVRDSLADVLQTAVEQLATDIRGGLHKTMEEVVTRAITQEISKAKMSK